AAAQRPPRAGQGLEAPVLEDEPGDVVSISDGAPGVQDVDEISVHGHAHGPAASGRTGVHVHEPIRLDGEDGHIVARRVDDDEPALVLREDDATLVAEPTSRTEPAGRERPRAREGAVRSAVEDHHDVAVGSVGRRVDGACRSRGRDRGTPRGREPEAQQEYGDTYRPRHSRSLLSMRNGVVAHTPRLDDRPYTLNRRRGRKVPGRGQNGEVTRRSRSPEVLSRAVRAPRAQRPNQAAPSAAETTVAAPTGSRCHVSTWR